MLRFRSVLVAGTRKKKGKEQQKTKRKRIKASQSSQSSESAPPLPPEIIFDILTRLPFKPLLRFRSVCKLWCSIISDPHFIKSHLTNFSTTNINRRFIFSTAPSRLTLKSFPLNDVLEDGSVNEALELDYPLKRRFEEAYIHGSSYGLLLMVNYRGGDDAVLFLWSPSTRKSKRLPWIGVKKNPGMYRMFGFGYQESTDDYKVFAISCAPNMFVDIFTVKIYSLKTGNWKTVGDFHNCFPWDGDIIYLNGAFRWMINPNPLLSNSLTLGSFDLTKETYGEIQQPVYDEGLGGVSVGAFGEWLCVLSEYHRNCVDVWVMKVYGVEDSWTKLFSIPYLTDPGEDQFLVPLCIANDGKVLLQLGSKLALYDHRNCSFSDIQNFDELLGSGAYTFVETLVSPVPQQQAREIMTMRLEIKVSQLLYGRNTMAQIFKETLLNLRFLSSWCSYFHQFNLCYYSSYLLTNIEIS